MAHQNNATMLWIRRRNLSVLEFFAVGKTFRALFWCAVKGGVRCRKLTYLQFSRFPWSHFFQLHFFIGYFTLPMATANVLSHRPRYFPYTIDRISVRIASLYAFAHLKYRYCFLPVLGSVLHNSLAFD